MDFSSGKPRGRRSHQIGDTQTDEPAPGTIRFNPATNDFEGWNGLYWISLTGFQYQFGSVTDIDGNTYQTLEIGDQEWMLENLRVGRYNDNTFIPKVVGDVEWSNATGGAWIWYEYDFNYDIPYGKLYNFYAVISGKLCPSGWHVPSEIEWTILEDFLGGGSVAGGKMKERGNDHWNSPNVGATNESGFTGLPGGARNSLGDYIHTGEQGHWWSSSFLNDTMNISVSLRRYDTVLGLGAGPKNSGRSVRCLKDSLLDTSKLDIRQESTERF